MKINRGSKSIKESQTQAFVLSKRTSLTPAFTPTEEQPQDVFLEPQMLLR